MENITKIDLMKSTKFTFFVGQLCGIIPYKYEGKFGARKIVLNKYILLLLILQLTIFTYVQIDFVLVEIVTQEQSFLGYLMYHYLYFCYMMTACTILIKAPTNQKLIFIIHVKIEHLCLICRSMKIYINLTVLKKYSYLIFILQQFFCSVIFITNIFLRKNTLLITIFHHLLTITCIAAENQVIIMLISVKIVMKTFNNYFLKFLNTLDNDFNADTFLIHYKLYEVCKKINSQLQMPIFRIFVGFMSLASSVFQIATYLQQNMLNSFIVFSVVFWNFSNFLNIFLTVCFCSSIKNEVRGFTIKILFKFFSLKF